VYSAFNMGTVVGLYLTPSAVKIGGGWPFAFQSFGALGMALAVAFKVRDQSADECRQIYVSR
jgi:hypothetical protein